MIFVDVDVQRDFCSPDGALYVSGAPNDAFRRLTQFALDRQIPIVGSVDSHAYDAWEFASNSNVGPNGEDPQFPDHCVKGTPGWLKVEGTLAQRFRFVPNVPELDVSPFVGELVGGHSQAVYFEKEVYSLFANPLADTFLKRLVDQRSQSGKPVGFVVYGVATDYCVKAAALGLLQRKYSVTILTDAVAGITKDAAEQALTEMREAGAKLVETGALF